LIIIGRGGCWILPKLSSKYDSSLDTWIIRRIRRVFFFFFFFFFLVFYCFFFFFFFFFFFGSSNFIGYKGNLFYNVEWTKLSWFKLFIFVFLIQVSYFTQTLLLIFEFWWWFNTMFICECFFFISCIFQFFFFFFFFFFVFLLFFFFFFLSSLGSSSKFVTKFFSSRNVNIVWDFKRMFRIESRISKERWKVRGFLDSIVVTEFYQIKIIIPVWTFIICGTS